MITTALIVCVSLALFVCWFRSTAVLLLQTLPVGDKRQKMPATTENSSFNLQQPSYAAAQTQHLPALFRMLRKEYGTILRLGHLGLLSSASLGAESHILRLNFQLMTMWFLAIHRFRPQSGRSALGEMSATVDYLATAVQRG